MKSKGIDAIPVVDSGKLLGILSARDIAVVTEDKWSETNISQIMKKNLITGYSDETLHDAINRMVENHVHHLLIVDKSDHEKLIGLLAVHDIAVTYDLKKNTLFGKRS